MSVFIQRAQVYLLCYRLHDGCGLGLQVLANAPKCPTCGSFQSKRPAMMPSLLDISSWLVVPVHDMSLENQLSRCRVVWQEPTRQGDLHLENRADKISMCMCFQFGKLRSYDKL
jgi:hypothetical protein